MSENAEFARRSCDHGIAHNGYAVEYDCTICPLDPTFTGCDHCPACKIELKLLDEAALVEFSHSMGDYLKAFRSQPLEKQRKFYDDAYARLFKRCCDE